MTFLSSLITSAWAIREELRPIIASTLARIARGEPISDAARVHIDGRRKQFLAEHPGAVAARDDEPFQRLKVNDASGGGIAAIGVYGVLTQRGGFDIDTSEPLTSSIRLMRAVQAAAADPTIGGIVLDVDSPGGTVYGIAELAEAIYSARASKPVTAIANSCAASAAYWLASQASELYAAPGAEVGSIGVYTVHADVSEALHKAGVDITLISAGKYKTETSAYAPLEDEARSFVQSSVDQYYDAFVRAVARGRGTSQKAVREGMGQGRMLLPDGAKAERMIDGVATLDQVIAKVATRVQRGSSSTSSSSASSLTRAAMQRATDIASLQ
jgi:signal peptide peptidase SppA